ncbi:MAG: hypothetical protein IJU63_08370 [Bacteroidales bacterium]|nr:hypothetical protein [Bacteroidales bacterium]MCR5277154.1 hypothetical protein [Bacteroidales bacterium]
MKQEELMEVARGAAAQRGCEVIGLDFNDDDNIFEITLGKTGGDVDLDDCEAVHRAVLAAFDRNIEDYALTVGSAGISAEEADELLKTIKDNQ